MMRSLQQWLGDVRAWVRGDRYFQGAEQALTTPPPAVEWDMRPMSPLVVPPAYQIWCTGCGARAEAEQGTPVHVALCLLRHEPTCRHWTDRHPTTEPPPGATIHHEDKVRTDLVEHASPDWTLVTCPLCIKMREHDQSRPLALVRTESTLSEEQAERLKQELGQERERAESTLPEGFVPWTCPRCGKQATARGGELIHCTCGTRSRAGYPPAPLGPRS